LLKDVTYLFPHIIQNGIEDRYCLPITQKLGVQQATFEAVAFVHSVDKTWSFLLSIKDAHDLAAGE